MAINNLPEVLQDAIQDGILEREFQDGLTAKTTFRAIADREVFPANVGETITKTRAGLLPAATAPLVNNDNSDLSSGITAKHFPIEQYSLSVEQYGDGTDLNLVKSRVAIASVAAQNSKKLGEQARRTLDTLARNALVTAYLGGNTFVATTLSAAGKDVKVDDVNGFAVGQSVSVNGASVNTVTAVVADETNTSSLKAFGARSGTISFQADVSIANGTAGKTVQKADAAYLIDGSASSLLADHLLDAAAQLEANGVERMEDGNYWAFTNPKQAKGLFADPAVKNLLTGEISADEARKGVIGVINGVKLHNTNMNPQFVRGSNVLYQAPVVGKGALIEGVFTANAYAETVGGQISHMVEVDGVMHVTRPPLDALGQVITQSWAAITGFAAPTDKNTTPDVLPSASNAALKRAVIIQSR